MAPDRTQCPVTWDDWLLRDARFEPRYRPLFNEAVRWCGEGDRTILDAGCGAGMHVAAFNAKGIAAYGIDSTISAVAQENANKCGYVLTCGAWEDIAHESYDAVWSHHVLEHARDPIGYLEAWFDIVKPGGRLFLVVPSFTTFALPGHVSIGFQISQAIYLAALAGWDCRNYLAKNDSSNVLLAVDKTLPRNQKYTGHSDSQWRKIADRLPACGCNDWRTFHECATFQPRGLR